MDLKSKVREIQDFPKKGISFKDITTLLIEPEAFRYVVKTMAVRWAGTVDKIIALDARGFIFGSALAYELGLPLVLARKKGKLPAKTVSIEYGLEYGNSCLEVHEDSICEGDRILVVDDLLATGGTAEAVCLLVESLGGIVAGCDFVIELKFLTGRSRLSRYEVNSYVVYEED